jgi:hypothetical protein
MTPLTLFRSFLLAAAFAVVLLTASRAEDDATSIKFSDPSKPGTLKIAVSHGDILVHGDDTDEVTVRSSVPPEQKQPRRDGLRVLTSAASYSLTEKNNTITLSHGSGAWPGSSSDFEVTVPRNTNIVISNAIGGDLEITGVSGDLEVKSLNGSVSLHEVSGGALVETMNGEIDLEIATLVENKPISLTSMNGEVTVHLPVDAKANVHLRTHNGSILTDFEEDRLVTKTTTAKRTAPLRNGNTSFNSDEIRATVQAAVRVGVEAAREASRAAREAVREARRAHAGDDDYAEEDVVVDLDENNPNPPLPPIPPLPPVTGGKIVTGTLNGGGPELRITTMNGDVTLRKTE